MKAKFLNSILLFTFALSMASCKSNNRPQSNTEPPLPTEDKIEPYPFYGRSSTYRSLGCEQTATKFTQFSRIFASFQKETKAGEKKPTYIITLSEKIFTDPACKKQQNTAKESKVVISGISEEDMKKLEDPNKGFQYVTMTKIETEGTKGGLDVLWSDDDRNLVEGHKLYFEKFLDTFKETSTKKYPCALGLYFKKTSRELIEDPNEAKRTNAHVYRTYLVPESN